MAALLFSRTDGPSSQYRSPLWSHDATPNVQFGERREACNLLSSSYRLCQKQFGKDATLIRVHSRFTTSDCVESYRMNGRHLRFDRLFIEHDRFSLCRL